MIEIGTIIFEGISNLKDIVFIGIDLNKEKKREFLEKFVGPTFTAAELIYKDYTNSFSELLDNIRNHKNPEETVNQLEKKRLTFLSNRIQLQALQNTILEIEENKFWKNKRLKGYILFVKAINSFMGASNRSQSISWYQDFIREFKASFEAGENPFQKTEFKTISGRNHLLTIQTQIELAVHTEMPEAWYKVCLKYNDLKMLFI